MADTPIPAGDLPIVVPGSTDYTVGTQLGNARRFQVSEIVALAVAGAPVRGDPAKKYRTFGGVIRQTSGGAGWAFIDDSGHTPIGLTSLTENVNGTLTVTTSFTALDVGTVAITPDEDYAAAGLTVGASVTDHSQILSFFAPFEARLSGTAVAWGNYISTTGALFGVDVTNAGVDGTVVFTHPSITHVDSAGPAILVENYRPSGVGNGNADVVVSNHVKTGFTLQAMERLSAKVATNGSGVVTVTHELVTAPTATWNATSNQLEIAHMAAASPHAYTLQECTSNYRCIVASSSTSTLNVEFYSIVAGALTKYTGATAPASTTFVFTRDGNVPGLWSSSNRLVVRRGLVPVRCQDVGGSGNIWIAGTHSVA